MTVKTLKLTAKQELFVKEYLIDLNATQACIRAGYSENTAGEQGYENLMKPHIQQAIAEQQAERNKRLEVNQDYVLNRLIEIDQLDILDILDDDGKVKPINEWSKEWRQNVSSFEVSNGADGGSVAKVKFPDKVKNLELIGSHIQIGSWVNKQSIDINANVKAEVQSISDLMDEIANESRQ